MLILSAIDLLTLIARRFRFLRISHIDFATTIVSIGLFATFFGVLIGLYGFDSNNIASSVPILLEGLRFAFGASVLGMFLSLALSIFHKFLGGGVGDEEVLHSIDRKMDSLVNTLQSPNELIRQFVDMKKFLKEHMEKINTSLDQALVQLGKGATQEVIKALEKIMKEFNENLTVQFGDNFKELNAACLKMVEWQRNYKIHIDAAEKSFGSLLLSLKESCEAVRQLTSSNEKTQEICEKISKLVQTYDVQVTTLATHLETCKTLGEQAGHFLSSTQQALTLSSTNLNSFSGVIEKSVSKQSEALAELTIKINEYLPQSLGELERVLTNITNQFASDYRSLFQFITDKRNGELKQ
jgi:hypothetical protein